MIGDGVHGREIGRRVTDDRGFGRVSGDVCWSVEECCFCLFSFFVVFVVFFFGGVMRLGVCVY